MRNRYANKSTQTEAKSLGSFSFFSSDEMLSLENRKAFPL